MGGLRDRCSSPAFIYVASYSSGMLRKFFLDDKWRAFSVHREARTLLTHERSSHLRLRVVDLDRKAYHAQNGRRHL